MPQTVEIKKEAKIYEWPISFNHQHDHRRMFDNLLEMVKDFNDVLKNKNIPKAPDGNVDFTKMPFIYFFEWFEQQANKIDHDIQKE